LPQLRLIGRGMRIQVYIISVLVSLIAWGLILQGTRDTYRTAWHDGLFPNLKLLRHFDTIVADIRSMV
jgi:hypothetical protein